MSEVTARSSRRQEELRTELVAQVAATFPAEYRALALDYFRVVAPADVINRSVEDLAAEVSAHLELGLQRAPGETLVRVFSPSGTQGNWSTDCTIVQIVVDDVQFLVDSVTSALTLAGRGIHLLFHPRYQVQRDESGRIKAIGPAVDGEPAESWMCLEIQRETDVAELQQIEAILKGVLTDVALTVRDWPAMRQRAFELATTLRSSANGGSDEVSSAVDFINWLIADHFIFIGYAAYEPKDGALREVLGTGLGTLALGDRPETFAGLSAVAQPGQQILLVTKANTRSTVHRQAYLDFIGFREIDSAGRIVREHRFIGLFTSAAYTQPVSTIPVLAEKMRTVLSSMGLGLNTHSARDLQAFIETYPRDDLFQVGTDELQEIAAQALQLQERRQVKVFVRADDFGRFASVLVYFPRDRYTTAVRLRMEAVLTAAYGASSVDYTARVSESALARLHYVVHMPMGQQLPDLDFDALEANLAQAASDWVDGLSAELIAQRGEEEALAALRQWSGAFPEAFKEEVSPALANRHLAVLERLLAQPDGQIEVALIPCEDESQGTSRFVIYRVGEAITLSSVLPMLHDFSVEVIDERVYDLPRADGRVCWVYDFGLRYDQVNLPNADSLESRFCDAFVQSWTGQADSDGFNALVLHAGLRSREVSVIRAYAAYLRQAGTPFSQGYLQQVLRQNVAITSLLVELFKTRFDPRNTDDRAAAAAELTKEVNKALDKVASLDQDRILRSFLALVFATLRTNAYQLEDDGQPRQVLAFKLDPSQVPDLPLPLPRFEVWVFAPHVEGVHLRFAKVARGGLRWSDRLEDFRTEVLGLVKAQMVKNTVIVPTGAKGGFVVKRGPNPADREAWLAEGIACYKAFIGALLDITDNLRDGQVIPPQDVVRHDDDDTYLVVAADKGTATFSDIANQISLDRGFWLGDAFASGGSVGYDHKGMGITARGAWESVKRHFLELGIDTQTQDFTCVGVGDMSGDVFGNGMLLSEHIRLVAAFDHRHIFLDPNPDPAKSFAERRRLFDLPRSSWDDYDKSLISAGGGVHPRTAKSIELTTEVKAVLGIPAEIEALKPFELQSYILRAPVDLLWNGGIGTYVKASTETNAAVGDKANDSLRVNGADLRAKVVGEGGNLGCTQLGRIEAARAGVRINTDAVDNSAGVDTSDHEVNIKILLDVAIAAGRLDPAERTDLLVSMTDEVGALVLRDNYGQNIVLQQSRSHAAEMLSVYRRQLHVLQAEAGLNRTVEFLPSDAQLDQLAAQGLGLTSPELAVVMAYEKIRLNSYRADDGLLEEAWCTEVLRGYFPHALQERFADLMERHPLRREILSTVVVNELVNRGGITFMMRAAEESGAGISEIARAYLVVRDIFGLPQIWADIEALDGQVSSDCQIALYFEVRRLLDRAVRWFMHARGGRLDVLGEIGRFSEDFARLAPQIPDALRGAERERYEKHVARLIDKGAPEPLARRVASLLDVFSLLDIVEASRRQNTDAALVTELYFALSERFDVDRMLVLITALPRDDRWTAMARGALRSDLYAAHASLVNKVLKTTDANAAIDQRIAQWESQYAEGVGRTRAMLDEIVNSDQVDLATLSVALRAVRTLVA